MITNLKLLSTEELISSTETSIRTERLSTAQVLKHFKEIERRRLYFEKGYASLFDMATRHFGYSASAAQRRIQSMRLTREMPEVENKIESGELSLTAAANVQTFFNEKKDLSCEEKQSVIAACMNKSSREVEKLLASRSPEKDRREAIRFTNASRLRMSLNISEQLYQKLETLKFKHRLKTIEEVVELLADYALIKSPAVQASKSKAALPARETQTRYIPKATKRIVVKQNAAQQPSHFNRCEFIDLKTQERCKEIHKLQFDHIHPYSKGGPNIIENLRLLCASHNRQVWWSDQRQKTEN